MHYMYYLEYWDITSVSQLDGSNEDHIELYSSKCCKKLLEEISHNKKIGWQNGWMYALNLENQNYINMIGLHYSEKAYRAVLGFGSKAVNAKQFYTSKTASRFDDYKKYSG